MLGRTKIFPYQKEKITSEDKKELDAYFRTLLSSLSRMYEDIANEFVPTYEETLTWNPASLVDGAGTVSGDIFIPGVQLGDYIQVGAPYDLQGILCSGYVRIADNARIVLFNKSGGTIDLASGDWSVKVTKRRV